MRLMKLGTMAVALATWAVPPPVELEPEPEPEPEPEAEPEAEVIESQVPVQTVLAES